MLRANMVGSERLTASMVPGGGTGGTTDHSALINRGLPSQHPISAIEGLGDALESKADKDELPPDLTEELAQVKEDIGDKLTEPPTAQVGQFFRVASIDADGHYVLEAVDAPAGQMKIKFAGAEQDLDEDGYVDIPIASLYQDGLLHLNINANESGLFYERGLKIAAPSELQIDLRSGGQRPIVTSQIPYVYKSAATAAESKKDPAWTPEEQAAAQKRIGIITLTQEEYDLLETKGKNTIYIIVDARHIYVGNNVII